MRVTILALLLAVVATATENSTTESPTWTMCSQHPVNVRESIRMNITNCTTSPVAAATTIIDVSVEILLDHNETLCMVGGSATIEPVSNSVSGKPGASKLSVFGFNFSGDQECLASNFHGPNDEKLFGISGNDFDRLAPVGEASLVMATTPETLPMNHLFISAVACSWKPLASSSAEASTSEVSGGVNTIMVLVAIALVIVLSLLVLGGVVTYTRIVKKRSSDVKCMNRGGKRHLSCTHSSSGKDLGRSHEPVSGTPDVDEESSNDAKVVINPCSASANLHDSSNDAL